MISIYVSVTSLSTQHTNEPPEYPDYSFVFWVGLSGDITQRIMFIIILSRYVMYRHLSIILFS